MACVLTSSPIFGNTLAAKVIQHRGALIPLETVQLKFLVGADGKVIESAVEKSSGFRRLDEAARAGLSKCQFKPATVDGNPQQSWASMKYTWRLE